VGLVGYILSLGTKPPPHPYSPLAGMYRLCDNCQ